MTNFNFEDFAKTTLSGAKNGNGQQLLAPQTDRIIAYLESAGSGPDAT